MPIPPLLKLRILIFAVLMTGCGSSQKMTDKPPPPAQTAPTQITPALPAKPVPKPQLVSAQPDTFIFDPLELGDDGILIPRIDNSLSSKSPVVKTVPAIPDSQLYEDASRLGFRVQIFASTGVDAAKAVEGAARDRFAEGVYLSYDPPTYKIRIGNCETKPEADLLLKKAFDLGYKDSWIVKDYITVKIKKTTE